MMNGWAGDLDEPVPAGVDSATGFSGDARLNPYRVLPSVHELRGRLRQGESSRPDYETEREAGGRGEDVALGVDVARFGSDSTAICVRSGQSVVSLDSFRREDTMATTGRVAAAIRRHRPAAVFVDEIGIGAGVVDRLKELGFHGVRGVNVSARAKNPTNYANLRAEMFDALRVRLEQGTIRLPDDQELAEQLASLRYRFTSSGQVQLESKQEMTRRGLRSPDKADAVALAFWGRRPPLRARL
nr:hypothetical protein 9 [Desulfobacterales bacterium]